MTEYPETFDNYEWLRANEDKLLNLIPKNPFLMDLPFFLKFGFGLKLLGVDWREVDELAHILTILTRFGFMRVEFQVGDNMKSVAGMAHRAERPHTDAEWGVLKVALERLNKNRQFLTGVSNRMAARFLELYQLHQPKDPLPDANQRSQPRGH